MTTPTPSTRLATVILGKDLGDWVREQRAAEQSWASIAKTLHEKTNEQVSLSSEHLRRLYGKPHAA